ncbi:MAG TPA: 2,3-bisphosphoglycerate-independent phosphoglycerate mutase [Thermoanaerobaculia bacterium]|nr:2,3-bisphosphoglycerate-independent phosphoglycerate mutase [Thermoanaerobaculia bacterium]
MSRQGTKHPRSPLEVIGKGGERQPFLRGMITHDLVQRGLPFADAYALARALRDELAPRRQITTAELGDIVEQRLEAEYGHAYPPQEPPPQLAVTYDGQSQPFSRGLLAQSLYAAGLDLDRAYRRVLEIQRALIDEGVERIDSRDLARRVAHLLDRNDGHPVGGRYRLIRRLRDLPRPLVVFLGGASGTGKSTLSLELAPLLRIYRINSTDTIRQVMRMAFSPAMLPALHRSSFELGPDSTADPNDRGAVLAAFAEQATRVCVGVRAVVERSIAENTSVLVEGVHLLPPLVPFSDLAGAAYQLMLMVSTMDEEVHRSHLLSRAGLVGRRASRYLEHFRAIRHQQELLLERAEEHEIPLLDTTGRERTGPRTAQLITDLLEQRLPWLAAPEDAPPGLPASGLLLVVDGLPDRPLRALGGRTPLEAARTPTFDRLAREGRVGLADPIAPGVVPDTASGNLALFGQPPLAMKRGPIEALGAGLALGPDAIALRANLATLDDRGWVIDRRAGRIRDDAPELAAALDRLPLPDAPEVTVRVHAGTEHRLAVVLDGPDLSSELDGSDPGETAPPGPPLEPRPHDPADRRAQRTAELLDAFEREARRVLGEHPVNRRRLDDGLPPANCLLTRGAGRVHSLEPLAVGGRGFRLACVSGDRTVLGIASAIGAEIVRDPSMTANLDTDLQAKFAAAAVALEHSDLVVLHVKGADIAAHDRRPDAKVEFIERLDAALGRFLEGRADLRVAVASDHATFCDSGGHGADPVPVLLWGPGIPADAVTTFTERTAAGGGLQRFPLQLLVERLFERFASAAS